MAAIDPLILASSSAYRRQLLERLQLPFEVRVRPVDETALADESPAQTAMRLAVLKAQAVAAEAPTAWVLGSDQVCSCAEQRLGKPGSTQRAVEQLLLLSGRRAEFHTAVALLREASGVLWQRSVVTTVHFRRLDRATALRYLSREPALDCAGSFKAEGLGITLCERISAEDPTALLGLPLISVRQLLAQAGWELP
jgi:septum formation protein